MFLYTRNVLLNTKATEKRGTPMQPTAQKNNAKQRKTIAIVAVIAVVAIARSQPLPSSQSPISAK